MVTVRVDVDEVIIGLKKLHSNLRRIPNKKIASVLSFSAERILETAKSGIKSSALRSALDFRIRSDSRAHVVTFFAHSRPGRHNPAEFLGQAEFGGDIISKGKKMIVPLGRRDDVHPLAMEANPKRYGFDRIFKRKTDSDQTIIWGENVIEPRRARIKGKAKARIERKRKLTPLFLLTKKIEQASYPKGRFLTPAIEKHSEEMYTKVVEAILEDLV